MKNKLIGICIVLLLLMLVRVSEVNAQTLDSNALLVSISQIMNSFSQRLAAVINAPFAQSKTKDIIETIHVQTEAFRTAVNKGRRVNSQMSLWHSPNQLGKYGISSGGAILEINFSYDMNEQPALTISNVLFKNGYAPMYELSEEDYVLEMLDNSGRIVKRIPFVIPNKFDNPPPLEGENKPGRALLLKKVDFSLTVEWLAQTAGIQAVTTEGVIVASKDLSDSTNIPVIHNLPNFRSIPGNEFHHRQPTSINPKEFIQRLAPGILDKLFSTALAEATPNMLDITFIGDDYFTSADLKKFHKDVNKFIAQQLAIEPFKSRAPQIMYHYVDNTTDLGCTYNGRLITCNNSTVTQQVNNSGAPYDKIVVIVNNSTYGGSGGPIAVAYNGSSGPLVFVHEFGHSFGGLIDEYNLYSTNGIVDNKTYANCYAGTPPASDWLGLVAQDDYALGCTFPNWYRSFSGSIMIGLSYPYFNAPSQMFLNQRISDYATSFSDINSPSSIITNPFDGAIVSGTIPITTSLADDNGIARAELWKDDVLFRSVYVSPFSFYWPTNKDTNGSHTLQVKAYDVAGNIGVSSTMTVVVNNSSDVIPPLASITYPISETIVSDVITVSISASDNSGTVGKVELYKDGILFGSDIASPFNFVWDTITETNGSHSLQAKAYDLSGNIGVSSLITVMVQNEADITPPTVIINAPLNGSMVPLKGNMKIDTSVSDVGDIVRIDLVFDGSIIQTCSSAISCSTRVSVDALSSGPHMITAKAYDFANNAGEANITVYK